MNGKGKGVAEAITKEVAEWPGAEVTIVEPARGHPKAKLKFGGKFLQVVFPSTPSGGRTIHNTLSEIRKSLKKMGAERPKPEPTKDQDEAPYRPKNDGAAKRPDPVKADLVVPEPDLADKLISTGVVGPDMAAAAKEAVAAAKPKTPQAAAEPQESRKERDRREFEARVAGIVDGVYFGLPSDVYHAVERASSSFLQKVDISPATAWRGSWMDPDRPPHDEDETIWQIIGRAYHVARLEPHLFEDLYVRELEKAEAPAGTLFTVDDMKPELEEYGLRKSGKAIDLAQSLADAGFPEDRLWHLMQRRWQDECGTRTPLSATHYDQMLLDRDRISKNSKVAPLLSGGEAEVSVFWTDENGVRMKARMDYLTRDWWVDFKTFDNSRGKAVKQALIDAMRYNRYYMQVVVYREAVEAIRLAGLDVIEAQTEDQRALVAALRIKPGELQCWYVFQEKGGTPNLLAYEFPFYMVPMQNLFEGDALAGDDTARRDRSREAFSKATQLFMKGRHDVLRAKQLFVLYSQVYEDGEPWFPIDPIGRFDDEDFHPYWLSGDMH